MIFNCGWNQWIAFALERVRWCFARQGVGQWPDRAGPEVLIGILVGGLLPRGASMPACQVQHCGACMRLGARRDQSHKSGLRVPVSDFVTLRTKDRSRVTRRPL